MVTEVLLRPAVGADAAAVAALETEVLGTDAWSADAVAADLVAPGRWWCVAVERAPEGRSAADVGAGGSAAGEGGTLVGHAALAVAGDVADLLRIAVAPSRQRSGLATRLLDEACAAARAAGADRLLLEVSSANAGARAFYAARGLSLVSTRPRYYRDGSDALVMRRALGPACGGGGR